MVLVDFVQKTILEEKGAVLQWKFEDEYIQFWVKKEPKHWDICIWSLARWERHFRYHPDSGFTFREKPITKIDFYEELRRIELMYSSEDLRRQFE